MGVDSATRFRRPVYAGSAILNNVFSEIATISALKLCTHPRVPRHRPFSTGDNPASTPGSEQIDLTGSYNSTSTFPRRLADEAIRLQLCRHRALFGRWKR